MLGLNITDEGNIQRKTNSEMNEALNQADMVKEIKTLRLKQFGHLQKQFKK